jgi:hypothetical protein
MDICGHLGWIEDGGVAFLTPLMTCLSHSLSNQGQLLVLCHALSAAILLWIVLPERHLKPSAAKAHKMILGLVYIDEEVSSPCHRIFRTV